MGKIVKTVLLYCTLEGNVINTNNKDLPWQTMNNMEKVYETTKYIKAAVMGSHSQLLAKNLRFLTSCLPIMRKPNVTSVWERGIIAFDKFVNLVDFKP